MYCDANRQIRATVPVKTNTPTGMDIMQQTPKLWARQPYPMMI